MQSRNWRQAVKPLFIDHRAAKEGIEMLKMCQPKWKNACGFQFVWYYAYDETIAIAIPVSKVQSIPIIIKNGKILEVPWDLD
jgi:hypothetical protein